MPHGITQCYLPPGRGDIPALTPAEAGARLSDPGGMQGWVDLMVVVVVVCKVWMRVRTRTRSSDASSTTTTTTSRRDRSRTRTAPSRSSSVCRCSRSSKWSVTSDYTQFRVGCACAIAWRGGVNKRHIFGQIDRRLWLVTVSVFSMHGCAKNQRPKAGLCSASISSYYYFLFL